MEDDPGASEHVIETLRNRGWCFGDLEQVKAIIIIHTALADDSGKVVDSVESELADMDLTIIGGKSLPDSSVIRKSSHLPGPKVLQISSVRDISKSSIEEFSKSSGGRLLRLGLTDGLTEITAIEYSQIPSISDEAVPGTKVRLEDKAPIHSGIVCLNPKVLTMLGGVVPSLHEEWQMNKKYSGFSRSSLRLSQESDGSGPPPFEKLQVGLPQRRLVQQGPQFEKLQVGLPQHRLGQRDFMGSSSRNGRPAVVDRNTKVRLTGGQHNLHLKANDMDKNTKSTSFAERTEEKSSSSETRPKEVVEYVPVQNQAAAQKLLQKMSQQNHNDGRYKGRRSRGKEKQEEPFVLTLDEWEKKKAAGVKPQMRDELHDVRRDEDLAWQLQNQFDLEDANVHKGHGVEAEDIRMSMFRYQREDSTGDQGRWRQGRGREAEDIRMSMASYQREDNTGDQGMWRQGRGREAEDIRMNMFSYQREDSTGDQRMWRQRRGREAEDIRMSMFTYQREDSTGDQGMWRQGRGREAEDIRMSMFSYQREDSTGDQGMWRQGRGRGRGGGRGRGRGRGRF